MKKRAVRIHPHDNVATALDDLVSGDIAEVSERDGSSFPLQLAESVPFGHKMAVEAIEQGEDVIKYGASIGVATQRIRVGEYVHTHNLASKRARARGSNSE
jgi:altronate dehydratase small subunit